MSPYQEAKLALVDLLGLPKDALHVYVGLIVFLSAAALLRRPLASWMPLLAVAAAALAGEAWDIVETRAVGDPVDLAGNWHDLWNTCLWPAVLFLLARYTQVLRRGA